MGSIDSVKATREWLWLRAGDGRFFRYKGVKGLKWRPRPLGAGGGERCLLSPLRSCEGSPRPSWAGGLGALPEAQNGGGRASAGRASRGGVEEEAGAFARRFGSLRAVSPGILGLSSRGN